MFIKGNDNKTHITNTESALKTCALENCPQPINVLYLNPPAESYPPQQSDANVVISDLPLISSAQSYAAVAALSTEGVANYY